MSEVLYGGSTAEGLADEKAARLKVLKQKWDKYEGDLSDENGDEFIVHVWYRDNWTRPMKATHDSPAEGGHEIEIHHVEDEVGNEIEPTEEEVIMLVQKITDSLDDPNNQACDKILERGDR